MVWDCNKTGAVPIYFISLPSEGGIGVGMVTATRHKRPMN